MRTADELDRRHEEVVARFPGGLTREQFQLVTLESADDDGRVYPHSVADWFAQQSLLMGMWMEGLIDHRDGPHKPFRWLITDKGREWLRTHAPSPTRPGQE
jgi:hypothetical protein